MTPHGSSQIAPQPPERSARFWLGQLSGWLCLLATLLLLSPGVALRVHAEPLESEAPAGPSCAEASHGAEQAAAQMHQLIEQMRAQALAAGESEGEAIVLNNRGYNYGPAPTPDPSLVEAERRLR